jgi:hypothetical protein
LSAGRGETNLTENVQDYEKGNENQADVMHDELKVLRCRVFMILERFAPSSPGG